MASLTPAQTSPFPPRPKSPSILKWLLCAAFVLGLVALLASFLPSATPENSAPEMAPASSSAAAPAAPGSVVVDPGAAPSPEELTVAEYLAKQGHRVRLLRRDPASAQPQPDAQLDDDDFPTEIKTVGNITGEEVDARLASRIREAFRQAPSVVVDARNQETLTKAEIESAMRRGIGMAQRDAKPVKRLHVIGPNGVDIEWDYTK